MKKALFVFCVATGAASLCAATLCAATTPDRTLLADAPVESVFFSPDSKTIAASSNKHVRTWEVSSGKVLGDRPTGGLLLSANLLAERSADRKATFIWDLAADRRMYSINQPVSGAALSSDGKQLAISSEKERRLSLLDAETGTTRRQLADGVGGAASLAFSPDGSTVVSANEDNDVRVWRTNSGELVRRMEDFTGAMFAAAFTPDGRQLLMGGLDETVYIFDATTYTLQRKLTGHGETILALAISPDGRTLVTGGFDVFTEKNPVHLVFWDLAAGVVSRRVDAPHAITALTFAPDGHWLAMTTAGGKEISLFSLSAPRP